MTQLLMLEGVELQREEETILKIEAWQVLTNEWWMLTGERGSGKSSLLALLFGEVRAATGLVWVMDYNLRQLSAHTLAALRRSLGLILPRRLGWLPNMSLSEQLQLQLQACANLYEPSPLADDRRILQALEWAELDRKNHTSPATWSGKQQLQAQFARALLLQPALFLLDEPFVGQQESDIQWLHERLLSWQQNFDCAVIIAQTSGLWQHLAPARAAHARCENGRLTLL